MTERDKDRQTDRQTDRGRQREEDTETERDLRPLMYNPTKVRWLQGV